MFEIKESDKLLSIVGGLNISGSIINAFSNGIKTLYDLGKNIGTAIRRIRTGALCKLWLNNL